MGQERRPESRYPVSQHLHLGVPVFVHTHYVLSKSADAAVFRFQCMYDMYVRTHRDKLIKASNQTINRDRREFERILENFLFSFIGIVCMYVQVYVSVQKLKLELLPMYHITEYESNRKHRHLNF